MKERGPRDEWQCDEMPCPWRLKCCKRGHGDVLKRYEDGVEKFRSWNSKCGFACVEAEIAALANKSNMISLSVTTTSSQTSLFPQTDWWPTFQMWCITILLYSVLPGMEIRMKTAAPISTIFGAPVYFFLSASIPCITQALASLATLSISFGSLISLLTFFLGTSNPASNPGLAFKVSYHLFKFGNSSISTPAQAAELTHPKFAISAVR